MKFCFRKNRRALAAAVLAWCSLIVAFSAPRLSNAAQSAINAMYLLTVPSDYQSFEKIVSKCKDSGANTLVIRPVSGRGTLDKRILAKAVFFAHAAGMKLYAIVPTRGMSALLDEHPEWEDLRYDLESGTLQPTGKVDLLNQKVAAYFLDVFKDIAGYFVDGILLDEDYQYRDVEGMGVQTLDLYKQKFGSSFSPRAAFEKVKGPDESKHTLEQYGEGFWNLTQLKKDALFVLVTNLAQSAITANKDVKIGVPLPGNGLFVSQKEMLAWYSLDIAAIEKMDAALFWISIPHREIRQQQGISYKKTIEMVSRLVTTAISLVNDPLKLMIGIQTTAMSHKLLPISEIEEVSYQAKKAGEPGIALMVEPDYQLPAVFTKKIFNRQLN